MAPLNVGHSEWYTLKQERLIVTKKEALKENGYCFLLSPVL